MQRILLLDGPAVLGWARWRELEGVYGLGAIREMLERAVEEGDLAASKPVDALAHILLAAAFETYHLFPYDEAVLVLTKTRKPDREGE